MSSHGLDPGTKPQLNEAIESIDPEVAESSSEEIDPASYRDLTKEEVLDRIASGLSGRVGGG